ncbi:MAG: DUF6174 domain-containing protein [Meiothermus sp.]|nr:DUF6174 domain-containing protein [Meiothermus sp.]
MRKAILGLALTAGLLGCGSPNPNLAFQQRWENQQINDYRFTLEARCFCPKERVDPVRVEVRGGQPVSLVYADSGAPPGRAYWDNENTIDKLFAIIQANAGKPGVRLEVTYDAALSYPARVLLDPVAGAVDDEVTYVVSSFERLP